MSPENNTPPVITHAMKEMLMNCRDREQLKLSPRLDYDPVTSKKLVDIGYLQPKVVIGREMNADLAFFVTRDGADYLSKLQRRVMPMVNIGNQARI